MFLLNKCFDIVPIYINKSNLLSISKTEKTFRKNKYINSLIKCINFYL